HAEGSSDLRFVDGHENGTAHLAVDRLRKMAFAADVLDQDHFARADDAALAVAGGDAHAAIEIDDVLAARRPMPVEIVVAAGLAKDDAVRRQASRELAAAALFDPFHLDVAKMSFALGIDVEIVDPHGFASRRAISPGARRGLAPLCPGRARDRRSL